MGVTKVPIQYQGVVSKTVDANGWTVTDFGGRKMYTRKQAWTGSQALGPNGSYVLPVLPLPVGISTAAGIILTYTYKCNDRIFLVNNRGNETNTNITLEVNQWYQAGTVNLTSAYVDLVAWDA